MSDHVAHAGPRRPMEALVAAAGLPPLPRQAWLEVNLDALGANAMAIRSVLPVGTRLGVVVKADGYGHGLVAAAHAALRGGASLLLVATLDEALLLRTTGFTAPILVLYPVPAIGIQIAAEHHVALVASDDASVDQLAAAASAGAALRVHLAIDTGMGRGGIAPEMAPAAARRLLDSGLPGLAGVWSHLASPEDAASTQEQTRRFDAAVTGLRAAGINPGIAHLAATGGLFGGAPALDLVRVGLAFYGHLPADVTLSGSGASAAPSLRSAMALKARAAAIVPVEAGGRVGYGGTWSASRESLIATLPVGYADGWTRAYMPGAWAVVRGRRVPLVGRVSSDAVTVDVTDVPDITAEDEFTLLGDNANGGNGSNGGHGSNGSSGARVMTAADLAIARGSIVWEVLDAFAPRLSRVYLESGRAVAVRYLDGVTVTAPGFELELGSRR